MNVVMAGPIMRSWAYNTSLRRVAESLRAWRSAEVWRGVSRLAIAMAGHEPTPTRTRSWGEIRPQADAQPPRASGSSPHRRGRPTISAGVVSSWNVSMTISSMATGRSSGPSTRNRRLPRTKLSSLSTVQPGKPPTSQSVTARICSGVFGSGARVHRSTPSTRSH